MSLYLDAVNIARSSAGLAIKEAESPTVTVANETAYTINSTLYSVASGDVSLALTSSRDGTWVTRTSALTLEDGKHFKTKQLSLERFIFWIFQEARLNEALQLLTQQDSQLFTTILFAQSGFSIV